VKVLLPLIQVQVQTQVQILVQTRSTKRDIRTLKDFPVADRIEFFDWDCTATERDRSPSLTSERNQRCILAGF